MNEVLKASLLYRIGAAVYGWFSRQWMQSRLIRAFLNMKDEEAVSHSSVFYRLGYRLRNIHSGIFRALRLDRVFRDSFLAKPFMWCLLAAALAPIVPTMVLMAFVALACVTSLISSGLDRDKPLQSAPVNRYILMYAIMYIIATFMSVTISGSLYAGLLTTLFVMSAFAIENAITREKQLRILVFLMVGAGVLVSLYGFYQYIFGTSGVESWVDEDMFSSISTRVYSTLQNPNVLSEYLLLIIPLSAACFFAADNFLKRIFYFCTSGIMCVCMLMTFSRAGWLGLLFAVVIFLILLDRRFILLIILGAVLLVAMAPSIIVQRFSSIGNMSDGSTSYRVAIWMGAIQMLKDYWLTGVGPGTQAFNNIYPSYSFNTATAQHSHNLFLQIMCDGGIIAIIIFVILIVVFIRMMCTAISREKNRRSRIFQISSLASIGGFMVQSLADYSFYNYRVMFLFWTFIALGTVFRRMSSLEGARPEEPAAGEEMLQE